LRYPFPLNSRGTSRYNLTQHTTMFRRVRFTSSVLLKNNRESRVRGDFSYLAWWVLRESLKVVSDPTFKDQR